MSQKGDRLDFAGLRVFRSGSIPLWDPRASSTTDLVGNVGRVLGHGGSRRPFSNVRRMRCPVPSFLSSQIPCESPGDHPIGGAGAGVRARAANAGSRKWWRFRPSIGSATATKTGGPAAARRRRDWRPGLLSGLTGTGGVILMPILLLFRWARVRTATVSALFILLNSSAGGAARAAYQHSCWRSRWLRASVARTSGSRLPGAHQCKAHARGGAGDRGRQALVHYVRAPRLGVFQRDAAALAAGSERASNRPAVSPTPLDRVPDVPRDHRCERALRTRRFTSFSTTTTRTRRRSIWLASAERALDRGIVEGG